MPLDPGSLPAHLTMLDEQWEVLLDGLKVADVHRREALSIHLAKYATAYISAPVAASAEGLRKQTAIAASLVEGRDLEHWESEVRFYRDQLNALRERTGIARSLYAGVKQATT